MRNLTLSKNEKLSVKKILVIQTAFIGDAILSTAIFKGITKLLPNTEIDVLAIPQTSNLYKNNPHIKNVYEFDKRKLENRTSSFIKVLSLIRKNKYDLGISIQSSFTSSLLLFFGRIKFRIGYPRQKLLTHTIIPQKGLHIRKRVLRLLEPISKEKLSDQTELFWDEEANNKIAKVLEHDKSKMKVALAPGSAQKTKQWPKEYFGELIKKMEDLDISTYLIGGNEDNELCDQIIDENKLSSTNLAGDLSILESAALLSKLNLVISNDSAPLHIANAVQTDVFAIFGPTVKSFGFYPYRDHDKILEVELECRPCGKHGGDKCPLDHFKCMRDLSPNFIFEEVKSKFLIN